MVTVYNAGGTDVLNVVAPKHARKMLHRGVARVRQTLEDGRLVALELLRYVFPRWRYSVKPKHYSKQGILLRDGNVCAYCAGFADTVDHVVPRVQGGRSVWSNVVAACSPCNYAKGGRTPQEAGMVLGYQPRQPA